MGERRATIALDSYYNKIIITNMTQKLLRVGSSAAVTIPKKSLKELGLKIGDEVFVEVNRREKRVIIERAGRAIIKKDTLDWADRFIERYRPALSALAKK